MFLLPARLRPVAALAVALAIAPLGLASSPARAQPVDTLGVGTSAAPGADRARETLDWPRAVALALERNPDAGLVLSALEASRADRDRAGVRPNPQLVLSTGGLRPRGPTRDSASVGAEIDQLIERGNKRGLRIDAADAQVAAAGQDVLDTRRQLLQALAEAFVDVASAERKLAFSREIAETFERAAGLARKRVDAGDLSPVEATRAAADAARAANDVTAAAQELDAARVQLALLVGRPESAARLTVDAAGIPDRVPADLDALVEQRADVRAARARLQSAESALSLARAQRVRDVTVGVQTTHAPMDAGPSLGLTVSIPLFTQNYFEGDIRRAAADRDTAALTLEKARQVARADAARAQVALRAATERERRIREDAVPLARRAADAIEFAFARGAATVLDVLDARRQLRGAELDGIAALADLRKARAALALLDPAQVPSP